MMAVYLKIAFRKLVRNRLFSLINIYGLASGVSVGCLIYLVIAYGNKITDAYHAKKKIRFTGLYLKYTFPIACNGEGSRTIAAAVPLPCLPDAIRLDFPQIEKRWRQSSMPDHLKFIFSDKKTIL